MTYSINDVAAAVVSVILVLGAIVLAVLGRTIPSEVATGLGAALTWLYVRSTQLVERHNGLHAPPPVDDA